MSESPSDTSKVSTVLCPVMRIKEPKSWRPLDPSITTTAECEPGGLIRRARSKRLFQLRLFGPYLAIKFKPNEPLHLVHNLIFQVYHKTQITSGQFVSHINGNLHDNSKDNLELSEIPVEDLLCMPCEHFYGTNWLSETSVARMAVRTKVDPRVILSHILTGSNLNWRFPESLSTGKIYGMRKYVKEKKRKAEESDECGKRQKVPALQGFYVGEDKIPPDEPETWYFVPNTEDWGASTRGRIWTTTRIIKAGKANPKRTVSYVTNDGNTYQPRISRVVAETFLGPIPDNHKLIHIDGNERNNRISNLKYIQKPEKEKSVPVLRKLKPVSITFEDGKVSNFRSAEHAAEETVIFSKTQIQSFCRNQKNVWYQGSHYKFQYTVNVKKPETFPDVIWKTIPRCPEYECSSIGEVRTIYPYKEVIPFTFKGKWSVKLLYRFQQYTYAIDELVCESFGHPCPSPDHIVMHKNGNMYDNNLKNLEWTSNKL